MEEKIILIEELIEKSKQNYFGEHRYLTSAILNTIEVEKLVKLYLETKNLDLKKTLDYHLSRRFSEPGFDRIKFFNYLIKGLKSKEYSLHQRNRTLLTYLIEHLPKKQMRQYFKALIYSEYLSDVKAALKVSDKVWEEGSENLFIDQYISTLNEKFLLSALRNGKPKAIELRLREIWECDTLENFIKTKIIRKLTPEYFDSFNFIKENEPDKYLYACAFSAHRLEEDEVKYIYDKLSPEQKAFGIWCIGKMQNWDFIKSQIRFFE